MTIFDRFVLSQVELIETALLDNKEVFDKAVKDKKAPRYTEVDKPKLPALIACVEKWEVEGLPDKMTVETFPLTPRSKSSQFVELVFDAIRQVYNGEIEVPNE